MKIKNKQILPILQLLLSQKDGENVIGLLTEDINMSLRRRLQKIRNKIIEYYKQSIEDEKDIIKKFKIGKEYLEELKDETEEQKKDRIEKYTKEYEIFLEEGIEILEEHASLEMIEAIKTKHNYDFEFIELIAK